MELKPIPPEEFRKQLIRPVIAAAWRSRPSGPTAPPPAQGIVPGDVLVGMHIWETDDVGERLLHSQAARLRQLSTR